MLCLPIWAHPDGTLYFEYEDYLEANFDDVFVITEETTLADLTTAINPAEFIEHVKECVWKR